MKYLITIMLIFFHLTVNGAIKAHLVNDKVKEFIKTRCLDCHNAKKQKGDVRLDNLAALIDDNGTAQLWQDVLDVINVGDMPPEDEDQPKHEELATFVGHLTDDLVIARKMLSSHGGQILMRRLNQFEYINTIEELTGVRLPESLVPEDPVGEGFNTQGEAQFFSQGMLERYSEAAEYALSRTIGARNVPYNKKKNIIINKAKAENLRMKKAIDAAVKEHQKALKVPKGTTDFKKYGFPNKGKYLAHLKDPQKRIKLYFSYQNHQLNQKGVVLWHNHTRDIKGGFKADSRAKYKIKINIAAENGLADEDKYISFYCGNMFIETFYVSGKIDKPQVIEIDYKPPFNFHKRTVPFDFRLLTNRISAPREKKFLAKNETPPGIWVGDIEIDGPFYSGEIKERANKILGGRDPNTISDSEVKELLNKFAQRAFRGKVVEGAYLDYLMKAYQVELAHSKNKGATLIKSLATILTSPQFLYLGEESTGKKRYVNETEMAHRISYMLLKRPAPKELISGEGKLTKDKHFFLAQINSLIKNPEFGTFIEEFFSQWLELYKYDILDVIIENNALLSGVAMVLHHVPAHMREIKVFLMAMREFMVLDNMTADNSAGLDPDNVPMSVTLSMSAKSSENLHIPIAGATTRYQILNEPNDPGKIELEIFYVD